jgi:hypothetical protein
MKNRTLQRGDSYPSRLTGIKGDQLSSCQIRTRSEARRIQETEYQTEKTVSSYVVKIV